MYNTWVKHFKKWVKKFKTCNFLAKQAVWPQKLMYFEYLKPF